jgi:hypothetical protein
LIGTTQPEHTAPMVQETVEPAMPERTNDPEKLRQSLLEQNKERLILHLRTTHGSGGRLMPQADLLEHAAGLHPDNIIFRTLSAAVLSTGEGGVDTQETERLLRYIRAVKSCDDRDLLRQVDPRGYSQQPRLMNALETAVQEILRLG